ncbi:uncharacterized protein LOC117117661 [Anneissia japonica]|uniref:uncharacterized protein LOC117117661 n=1 Tax=Anneissia japonica TaxID=1529436 RepID=UPI001425A248|nr:uncharacterized protein LOC117117661 [Anneissia japonica]
MSSIDEDTHHSTMSATERLASVKVSAYNQFVKWMERLQIQEWIECIKVWVMVHPLLALFAVVLIATTSVPIMIFLSFVVFVLLFGIISFAFIEGLLLTTSSAILLTTVGFIATAALGVTGFIVSCYFVMQLGHRFLGITAEKVKLGCNGVVSWYKPKASQEYNKVEEVKKE